MLEISWFIRDRNHNRTSIRGKLMAVTSDFVWRGATIPGVYVRVDTVRGGKREGRLTPDMSGVSIWSSTVGVYADSAQPVPIVEFTVNAPWVAEESPYVKLYAAIKAMPEFAGCVDC